MDQSHRLLLALLTFLAVLAACRPKVASIHLVNASATPVEASVELAGGPDHVTHFGISPKERYFFLKYDQRDESPADLTRLVKAVSFAAPTCQVVKRGDEILELASRDPEHAGWVITFRAETCVGQSK